MASKGSNEDFNLYDMLCVPCDDENGGAGDDGHVDDAGDVHDEPRGVHALAEHGVSTYKLVFHVSYSLLRV